MSDEEQIEAGHSRVFIPFRSTLDRSPKAVFEG